MGGWTFPERVEPAMGQEKVQPAVDHQCPLCYLKDREKRSERNTSWPRRTRELMIVQYPCFGCGERTFWRSIGEWAPGKLTRRPII